MVRNLVSHGTNTQGQNECWASYNDTSQIGYGPGYQYPCVHSGNADRSGGDTVWYNYALASAGTITDENTTQENPASNMNTATESICPKGWTLPFTAQLNANGDLANFSAVGGGWYNNGSLGTSMYGAWWGSEALNGATRWYLRYNDDRNIFERLSSRRSNGFYIRCVSEEKTATDLTYMQDMMFANDNMVL